MQLGLSGGQAEPISWTPVQTGFQLAGFGVLTEPPSWSPIRMGFQLAGSGILMEPPNWTPVQTDVQPRQAEKDGNVRKSRQTISFDSQLIWVAMRIWELVPD